MTPLLVPLLEVEKYKEHVLELSKRFCKRLALILACNEYDSQRFPYVSILNRTKRLIFNG